MGDGSAFRTMFLSEQFFGHELPDRLFFIGDNPLSDIAGANSAGDHWTSVLLRSGVFQGENDSNHPGDVVFDGVLDAVQWIVDVSE